MFERLEFKFYYDQQPPLNQPCLVIFKQKNDFISKIECFTEKNPTVFSQILKYAIIPQDVFIDASF
jgi:hypothetical protein